jgi:hypothetical protein
MTNQNNWQGYLGKLLTDKGQFKLVDTEQKGDTTIEYYTQQIGDKDTVIKLGHLKNGRLITMDITNPNTPGHNAEQIEYFYENDFDHTKKIGLVSVGLPYSDINQQAIVSILKTGLQGTEKKYFIDDKLQFSKVAKPVGDNSEFFEDTHYFVVKSLWMRLLLKLIKLERDYTVEEIELDKIFSGLK